MAFAAVTRKQAKLRMALTGVSGAGKTLSALYIAYGMTGDWSKVAMIDTEHERGRFYAQRSDLSTGQYLYAPLDPPYSPERYKALVQEGAEMVGPDGVVIIDSFSHAWNNEGGVLDIKDRIAQQSGKNSYTAWNEAGREQNSLVNAILAVDCHTIVTMRSKMDYALEVNDRGKQQPVKLGLAPVQRDDTEYEFDVVLDINRQHIATASKDTTFLDHFGAVVTPDLGRQLADWLKQGKEPERCADCGQIINATRGHTVESIVQGTQSAAGRQMCMDCFGPWFKRSKARAAEISKAMQATGVQPEQYEQCLKEWAAGGILSTPVAANLPDEEYARLLELLQPDAAQ